MAANLKCKNCGPLTGPDVATVTDYDQAAGAITTMRQCLQCGDGPVRRGA